MADRRYLEELMQFIQGANGADLKQRYAKPQPGETSGQRVDRKRTEFAEETDSSDGAYIPPGLDGSSRTTPGMNRDPNDDGGDPFTAKNPDGTHRMLKPTFTPERRAEMAAQNASAAEKYKAATAPVEEDAKKQSILEQLAQLLGR